MKAANILDNVVIESINVHEEGSNTQRFKKKRIEMRIFT